MPRTRSNIDLNNLKILKERVLAVAKIELKRSVDCDTLAKKVFESTHQQINGISFKRIYGFTKYPFNPAIHTLNI